MHPVSSMLLGEDGRQQKRSFHFTGQPKVHSGFLSCWYNNGMDTRVLKMAGTLIRGSFDVSKLKVYVTGRGLLWDAWEGKGRGKGGCSHEQGTGKGHGVEKGLGRKRMGMREVHGILCFWMK